MKNEITAKRLRLALDNANMKPQELAEKSKVSKSSISQYVNGSHAPSNISAGKIGKVLDVEPLWLMGFDVPMERMAFKDAPKNFHSSFDNIENFKVAYDKSKLRSNKLLNSIMENAEQLNNDNRKSLYEYSQNLLSNQRMEEALQADAAQARTDITISKGADTSDDDIMSAEDF